LGAHRAHWDVGTDAAAHVVWDENRTITAIVSVFGVAI